MYDKADKIEDSATERPASPIMEPDDGCDSGETVQSLDVDVERTAKPAADGVAQESGWDGPDDPENPMNWSYAVRFTQIILISFLVLIVNLTSTMFAPAIEKVMVEFDFTSESVASLAVSVFLVGFAVGPPIWAPISEIYGRHIVYASSTVLFLAFTLGCAFAKNLGSFMALRILSGIAGGSSMAISGGTLADVIPLEDRGRWMALFVTGILLGPVVGPIMGGFIGERAGWRWVFRSLTIATGVLIFVGALTLRETYHKTILRRRAHRRHQQDPEKYPAVEVESLGKKLSASILRSLQFLVYSPIVLFLSLYASFYFGVLFILFTTFATVFRGQYGWSMGISGLAYLGLGIGCFVGLIIQAIYSDRLVKKAEQKYGSSKPETRLFLMAVMGPALPVGIFWYGWTADKQTHWIVPILGTIFVGVGFIGTLMPSMIYLVDCFGAETAASAIAAQTLLRSTVGAFLPLAGPPLYNNLGLGWGNSVLAFISVGLQPIPWILYIYGDRIRQKSRMGF